MIRKTISAALIVLLAACATGPKPPRPVNAVLAELNGPPKPCREEYAAEGWRVDNEQCAADRNAHRQELLAELNKAYAVELRQAPACVAGIHLPPDAFANTGVDPAEPHAVANLIARGYFVAGVLRIDGCALAVCKWRRTADPADGNSYCERSQPGAQSGEHPL